MNYKITNISAIVYIVQELALKAVGSKKHMRPLDLVSWTIADTKKLW